MNTKSIVRVVIGFLAAAAASLALAATDVNKASRAELESIKGIGPSTSERLMAERQKQPFRDWSDLAQRVKGIGDKRAAKLSAEGLTVNGAAFASADATTPMKAVSAKSTKPAKAESASKAEAAPVAKTSAKPQ